MTNKVSLRMPRALIAALDDACQRLTMTRNAVIVLAVRRLLAELAQGELLWMNEEDQRTIQEDSNLTP